jgi:acyl-CoA thioesterase
MAHLLTDGDTLRRAGERQFELDGWIDTAPFEDLLGMCIEEAGDGRAVLSMPFPVKLAQGGGVLHGGALTALADTAVAIAIKTLLRPGTIFATIELTTRFLAPVLTGPITATATVTGPQGRSFVGESLLEAEGREVARFSATFRVVRGQGFEE